MSLMLKELEKKLKIEKSKKSKTFLDLPKDRKISWLKKVIAEKRAEVEENRTNSMVAILRGKMRREEGIGIWDCSYWANVVDLTFFVGSENYLPTEETTRLLELVLENENFARTYGKEIISPA